MPFLTSIVFLALAMLCWWYNFSVIFIPKLWTTLKTYNRRQFYADLMAGIVVGIVALPLAIAFAIASGVTPEKGLYTAIIAGFLISLLGGSRVQIGGPTGAFVVIVVGIIGKYGYDGLVIATIMAGFILIFMGLAKIGALIKFIPYPVVTGFTSGIGLIIFSSQVSDFFGLNLKNVPVDFVDKWVLYFRGLPSIHVSSLALGVLTLLIIFICTRISRRIPGAFVALVISTIVAHVLGLDVSTIQSRFGDLPLSMPHVALPYADWALIRVLIGPAMTIAFLAAVESLLSAVVADGMIGGRHRSNMELIAQGVANILSVIFSGIPATGAIARTATNIRNGGRTPIAGIIHAVVLVLIMLFFWDWVGLIPMASLAGILIYVAYTMSEHRAFLSIIRGPRMDAVVLLITFSLTVLVDLTVAIEIGMILAAFMFMKQMAEATDIKTIKDEINDSEDGVDTSETVNLPRGVQVFEINGPFFFGMVDKFYNTIDLGAKSAKVVILRMRNVPYMDAGGLHALDVAYGRCKRKKIAFFISEIQHQPLEVLVHSDLFKKITRRHVHVSFDKALSAAKKGLQG